MLIDSIFKFNYNTNLSQENFFQNIEHYAHNIAFVESIKRFQFLQI